MATKLSLVSLKSSSGDGATMIVNVPAPSSALCGTCLRGNGLCGNNGTHAYRSTLRADPGNIQGTQGAVLVPPVSGGA